MAQNSATTTRSTAAPKAQATTAALSASRVNSDAGVNSVAGVDSVAGGKPIPADFPASIDRSLRLPEDQVFPPAMTKSGIAIHHTVGGSALSTFNHWLKDRTKAGKNRVVGTAYIIDRDGTVFEVFEPTAWAFQFGLEWSSRQQRRFEQRFIGIELASEGALLEHLGKLYCFDRISEKTLKPRDEVYDHGSAYRGYRYFDLYEPVQIDRLVHLINYLCESRSIKRRVPYPPLDYYGERLAHFKGVIGHAMVRRDKSDPAPMKALWDRLIAECGLQPMLISKDARFGRSQPSEEQAEALFAANIAQIRKLATGAGSLVKGLIMELERRNAFIRLADAEDGGHKLRYEFVSGSKSLMKRLASALGIERVTDSHIEVRDD